jgi:tetratricopeptide (TPR) repeat protein
MKKFSSFSLPALAWFAIAAPAVSAHPAPQNDPPKPQTPASASDARPASREQRQKAYERFLQAQNLMLQNDFLNAAEALKEVIKLDPNVAAPHVELGALYLNNRNIREAEKEARLAIQLEPNVASGHLLLGRILAIQANDKTKAKAAIAEFETVVKLDKSYPDVYRSLGRLYLLTNDVDRALESYTKLMGNNLAGPEEYAIVTNIYLQKRQYQKAANAARQAFLLSGENPQLGLQLTDALLRSGHTSDALEVFKQLVADSPNDPRLILSYAEALLRGGKYAEAAKEVQKIINVEPNDPVALGLLAQVQRRSGKREDAVKTLQTALKGQDVTDSFRPQIELAEILTEMGRTEEGVSAYDTALKGLLNPDQSFNDADRDRVGAILQRMADAYKSGGQPAKALAVYDRMRKTLGATDPLPDLLAVDALRNEGKYDEAVKAARDARKRFPDERRFVYVEAELLAKLGQPDKAIDELQKLRKASGADRDDAEISAAAITVFLESNRLEDAEREVRRALQQDEKNIGYLLTLSSIQDRRKQYKESEATLRTILSLDPDNPTAMNNLGYFLTERNERLDEALSLIQRAVNIDPTNSSFLDSLGWVYFKQNQLQLAKQYIEQALGYDKRNATLHDHLGDILHKMGNLDAARKQWQTARGLSNDPEIVARIDAKIKGDHTGLR